LVDAKGEGVELVRSTKGLFMIMQLDKNNLNIAQRLVGLS
jgi:hypothetical protein